MTNVYFVRHAESDCRVHDDSTRPLTEKGRRDCSLVNRYLKDKDISYIVSSPYKRAFDTVQGFAQSVGLDVICMDDFAERRIADIWIEDFMPYARQSWEDFDFKLSNGESLREVQARHINALNKVLEYHPNENIVIGTHGTALSSIVNYYDHNFDFKRFQKVVNLMPWIVRIQFDGINCVNMESINPFLV